MTPSSRVTLAFALAALAIASILLFDHFFEDAQREAAPPPEPKLTGSPDLDGLAAGSSAETERHEGGSSRAERTTAGGDWTISGLVHSKRQPQAKVPVLLEFFAGYGTEHEAQHEAEVRSGANGRFTYTYRAPRGARTIRMSCRDEGWYARPQSRIVRAGAAAPRDLEFQAWRLDAELRGRVLGPGDQALRAARILCLGRALSPVDRDGAFRIAVPSGLARINVVAYADGYAPAYENVVLDNNVPTTHVVLRMKPGRRLFGTVKSPDGVPIAGAEVSTQMTRPAPARSDAYGNWELSSASAEFETVVLEVAKEGFAPTEHVVDEAGKSRRIDLVLEAGLRAEGVVYREDAKGALHPLEGARVDQILPYRPKPAPVYSDARGRFVTGPITKPLRSPWPAKQLVASHPGYAKAEHALALDKPETLIGIRLVLRRGHSVAGVVVDEGGKAVSGASVSISTGSQQRMGRTKSDSAGRFTLEKLGKKKMQLFVTKKGYLGVMGKLVVPGSAESSQLSITLKRACYACGRVADAETGAAVKVFRVRSIRPALAPGERRGRALGFADGSGTQFTTEDGVWRSQYPAREGSVFGIEVRAEGYALGFDTHVVAREAGDPDASVVRLVRAGRVFGRVVTEREMQAVSGARIRVLRGDAATSVSAATDSDGSFELAQAPPDSFKLRVRHPDHGLHIFGPYQAQNGSSQRIDLQLPRSAVLTGRVLGADGRSIAGFRVMLQAVGASSDPLERTSDATGRFRFDRGIGSGRYHLMRSWQETRMRNVHLGRILELRGGETTRCDLAASGRGALEVHAPALANDESAHIVLARLDDGGAVDRDFARMWYGLSKGRVQVRGLASGRYRVTYHDPSRPARASVQVSEGAMATVTLQVRDK